MGLRHVNGIAEVVRTFGTLDLVAVCDRHHTAAAHVAKEAERLMGKAPKIYTDFNEMLDSTVAIDALDITTDTRMHHEFAVSALDAGIHVCVEKPMGLTLKACTVMAQAAIRSGKTLAIAENYRRDPMNRLAKELIETINHEIALLVIIDAVIGLHDTLQIKADAVRRIAFHREFGLAG